MLKRQRPSTPPPPASTPDDLLPPQLDDFRSHKRPRVLPPSLDGQERGWANPPPASTSVPEDSDEEYIDEDELLSAVGNTRCGMNAGPPTVAYKEVNHFLHDLHAEHQHRLFFASTPHGGLAPPSQSHGFHHDPRHHNLAIPRHNHNYKDPAYLSFPSNVRYGVDENEAVYEQYEHQNRVLRDVFLARRRELSGPPPG